MATIKLNEKEIKKFLKSYEKFKINNKNIHALAMFRFTGCTITVFKTGKVLFQGQKAEMSATKWGYKAKTQIPVKKYESYIGSDEVGTGDFFGPIVVVALYCDNKTAKLLKKVGVVDSKKLNDDKIIKIAQIIKDKVKWGYSLINNSDYNVAILKINMNKIKALLHNDAINKLIKHKPQAIIVDEFVNKKNYDKYLVDTKNVVKGVRLVQKAESKYIGVAGASILARYIFIKEMAKISKLVGFKIQYGAGPKVNDQIKKLNDNILINVGKLNFKNYKNKKSN